MDVQIVWQRIRENELGGGSVVIAMTRDRRVVRIINARRRAGRIEGKVLATGKWVAITPLTA
jgi:hypothetical protein